MFSAVDRRARKTHVWWRNHTGLEPVTVWSPTMFIQTEATPNPATMKFLPGRQVMSEGVLDIPSAQEAAKSPLAEQLFAIPGVSGVFLGSDFITVSKSTGEWP